MSVNKVILIGNVGRNPEVRYTQGGIAVSNFALATNKKWKDKASGQMSEKVEWHNIVCWNKLADIVGQYVTKGKKLYVEGELQTRKWQDKNGADRYTTEILAQKIEMLSGGEQKQPTQQQEPGSDMDAPGFADQSFPSDNVPF